MTYIRLVCVRMTHIWKAAHVSFPTQMDIKRLAQYLLMIFAKLFHYNFDIRITEGW